MAMQIDAELERLIDDRLRSGRYSSASDVLRAALRSLAQDETHGQFGSGVWDQLLAEGERGGPSLEGEVVFAEIRGLRHTESRP